jgi:hypothetical protein
MVNDLGNESNLVQRPFQLPLPMLQQTMIASLSISFTLGIYLRECQCKQSQLGGSYVG